MTTTDVYIWPPEERPQDLRLHISGPARQEFERELVENVPTTDVLTRTLHLPRALEETLVTDDELTVEIIRAFRQIEALGNALTGGSAPDARAGEGAAQATVAAAAGGATSAAGHGRGTPTAAAADEDAVGPGAGSQAATTGGTGEGASPDAGGQGRMTAGDGDIDRRDAAGGTKGYEAD